MLGERLFKDNLERLVDILKYIESYSELSKRISEIEEKSSYDLFVKLYGSNISLKNELEQINSRYSKLYELAFEKSEYVDQLYNIRKLLNKPEIKILMLLNRLDSRFPQSSIEQVLMVASNNKYSKVDDIYFDYNSLIEVINKDKVNKQILNDWLAKKKKKENNSDNSLIIDDEAYWKKLKQYYYNLRDKVFLNPTLTDIKDELTEQHIISASFKRTQLVEDLKQVRTTCSVGKKR